MNFVQLKNIMIFSGGLNEGHYDVAQNGAQEPILKLDLGYWQPTSQAHLKLNGPQVI